MNADRYIDLFSDRTAPDGSLVRDNFAAWFGDSKTVDANGQPLRFYHGTARTAINKFNGDRGVAGHFAFAPSLSNQYADDRYAAAIENGTDTEYGDGAVSYPVYLKAENIFDRRREDHRKLANVRGDADYEQLEYAIERIRRAGFDAYYDFEYNDNTPTGIAVFSPSQIKSAIGNSGGFRLDDPEITDHQASLQARALRAKSFIKAATEASPNRTPAAPAKL